MSNRFHNKFHRNAHHTDATVGDIDSSTDPIASPEYPFLGDFHISGGELNVLTGSSIAPSGEFDNIYTNVIYAKSSDLTLSATNLIGLPMSKISDVNISGLVVDEVLVYDDTTSEWKNGVVVVPDQSIEADKLIDGIWGPGLARSGSLIELDFATSGDVIAGTANDLIVTPESLGNIKSDREFLEVTHNATGLTQSVLGTYEYHISGFNATGLETSEIRELHVECFTFAGGGHDTQILTSLPNAPTSPTNILCRSFGNNGDDDCGNGGLFMIPINKDQTLVQLAISGAGSHTYTIKGVVQRII